MTRRLLAVAGLACAGALSAPAAPPSPATPDEFADLRAELDQALDEAFPGVTVGCRAAPPPILFSAELSAANSHHAGFPDVDVARLRTLVDRFSALGLQAVTVTISYPYLLRGLPRGPGEYEAVLDQYRLLAQHVRRRGMKLIVKTQAMFPSADPALEQLYRGLSFDEYKRGRLEVARTIARELQPAFLSVQVEPDMEALATGQPVDTLDDGIDMVRFIANGLRVTPGALGTAIGAGVGTWQMNYRSYVEALAGLEELDYIDMHVYPIGRDYWPRALEIADLAAAAGKRVGMSEAWLYKIRDRELVLAGPLATDVLGRDPFSFWAPLDQRFLALTTHLASCKGLSFVSPSRSDQLFAYLDYERTRDLSPADRLRLEGATAALAAIAGNVTATGRAYAWLAARGRPGSRECRCPPLSAGCPCP
jgi:hypothetical protein